MLASAAFEPRKDPVKIEKRLRIQTLGDFCVLGEGSARELPRSRKTRGLLLYLALEDRRHRREDLCGLLFELPNDPRAALRWSLSKLRPLFGGHAEEVLVADRETVAINRDEIRVDLAEIRASVATGLNDLSNESSLDFETRLTAGLPSGLEDVGSVEFRLWLNAEQEALRELHGRVLDELVTRDSLAYTERLRLSGKRIALDPFDDEANLTYVRMILEHDGLTAARRIFDRANDRYREERRAAGGLVEGWMRLARTAGSAHVEPPTAPSIEILANDGMNAEAPSEFQALPDKPSLAVLDFKDLGSHAEGAVLANGLAADLNTRLAQLSNLFVIARASSTRIAAQGLSPRNVSRKLGVRYLVSGSTQRQDKRVRVTVTLLDATDESEIWSEHFDRPLDDLFEIQDDITNAVVATIEPAIERAEMQRALLKPPESLNAWEFYHRGLWHCFRFTAADSEQAHDYFARALERDPNFSRAHAGRSFAHYSRAFLNSVPDVSREIEKSLEAAGQSVGLDGRDSMGHWALGRSLFLSRRHDEALASIDQALSINPNYAQGHYAKGFIGIHAGLEDPSLHDLDRAERLSPFDPLLFAMKSSRGVSLALQGNYEKAAPWAIGATHQPNAHFHIHAIAAAILELAGRSDDAKSNAEWVLRREPNYTVEVYQRSFPHKDEGHREAMLGALARAGIPRGT